MILMNHGANCRIRCQSGGTTLLRALWSALDLENEFRRGKLFALFWFILDKARQDLYWRGTFKKRWLLEPSSDYDRSPLQDGLSSSKSLEFAQGLLDRGFDPHTPDQYGCVWFLYLDCQSNPETLDTLQKRRGANINFKDRHGRTLLALLSSSQSTDLSMMKHLLKNPAVDVNTKDKHGKTPLMTAVENGSLELIKTLLADVRSDPRATDKKNFCALDYAKKRMADFRFRPFDKVEEIVRIVALLKASRT